MAGVPGYLLDTNILVALVRGKVLGKYLDATFALSRGLPPSVISVVTVGEMHALARKFNWGAAKIQDLTDLLKQVVWQDINDDSLLGTYGEIDAAMDAVGHKMGKNDLWIAATARATGLTLLTTDKDFDPLEGTWINRVWVDPSSGTKP